MLKHWKQTNKKYDIQKQLEVGWAESHGLRQFPGTIDLNLENSIIQFEPESRHNFQ